MGRDRYGVKGEGKEVNGNTKSGKKKKRLEKGSAGRDDVKG